MAQKKLDLGNSEVDQQVVRKVDRMMNLRGEVGDDVAEMATSVNQELTKDLGQNPGPVKPIVDDSPPETAPELPVANSEISDSETQPEPVSPNSEQEPKPSKVEEPKDLPEAGLDDSYTDRAVDDIVAKEGDTILAVEDAKTGSKQKAVVSKNSMSDKFRNLFARRRAWLVAIAILLAAVFALPMTRYKILGLVVKESVTITVLDSKSQSPISNAQVTLAGHSAKTDAYGHVKISAGLGQRALSIQKLYYQDLETNYFVGLKVKNPSYRLAATGRLVPISVVNHITGQPISGAVITSQKTTAKTNSKGLAEIALPTKAASYSGRLTARGYLSTDINITVTDKLVKTNKFDLSPSGQIYFLSNRSGVLDVVKSNLDGSGRQTVLAGTGHEDAHATSLLASRDWRFLILKAHREGAQAALYMIDTSNDKVTQFDSKADFTLIGWYGHRFMYESQKLNPSYWQPGTLAIKSYEAERQQLSLLDQNQAEGASGNYAYQIFSNFYILDNLLLYNTYWNGYTGTLTPYNLTGKNDTVRGIQPDGQAKKDYKTLSSTNNNFIQASLYAPGSVYFAVYDKTTKISYYEFEAGSVKSANIDQATFDKSYPTFLVSPSGRATLWSELRDGKNTMFIGDASASNKKEIASLSEYAPYGWFADDYILLSKNNSELYIAPASQISRAHPPVKITDYYKPAQNFSGYGYGYGGL